MKSKYQVILDDLTTLIENNTYSPGDMLPTEKELTRQYSVSRTTVQRTLNILVDRRMIRRTAGKGTFVAERDIDTPDQSVEMPPNFIIKDTPPDDIVTPEALAGRRYGPTDAIMILPNHQAHVALSYLRGAETYLKPYGWNVTAIFSRNRSENVWAYADALADSGCGGFIIYPITSDDSEGVLLRHYRRGIPIVVIDKNVTGAAFSSVLSNNYLGGYTAASHFLDKGHRTFFIISNLRQCDSQLERCRGFIDALGDNGFSLPDDCFLEYESDDAQSIQQAMTDFLIRQKDALPAAAFCVSDMVATRLYRAAYTLDIHIPDRLSVIGFDDLEIARVMCPPLTTVAQNFFEIGRQAAIQLLRAKETNNQCVTKQYLPIKLVERESVAERTAIVNVT
ncbi:LacI family transcriptional regulator [Clostridia bacterium]|nr:LacI family transcriptional regulator [Clostridia bacterium]